MDTLERGQLTIMKTGVDTYLFPWVDAFLVDRKSANHSKY